MFLEWSRSPASIPELSTTEEWETVRAQDLTILFKHSPTCPISLFAHREVLRFRKAQPHAPVYLVSVRRRREVARHIAERTGVRHESPQILVLRRGNLVGAASHNEITAELLASLVASEYAENALERI